MKKENENDSGIIHISVGVKKVFEDLIQTLKTRNSETATEEALSREDNNFEDRSQGK